MLQPKRQKYRKAFRGRMRGQASRGNQVTFGKFGLKSLGRGWLSSRQIEAARKTITHHTKRIGKLWIRSFPDKPVTQKAPGSRMGSGKGDVDHFVSVVKPGRIIFEISGVSEAVAREAMRKASTKLPFKTSFVTRTE